MPTSTGISSLTQNIGKSKNTGIEIDLNFNLVKTRDLSVSLGANITFIKNEIVQLPVANRENGIIDGTKKLLEGRSINEFWLRQWYGVDAATGNGLYYFDAESYNTEKGTLTAGATNSLVTGPNGEKLTNSYSYAKYDFSGKAIPKFFGGFNLNAAYKGFDVEALFSYSVGSKVLDLNYASLMSVSRFADGMHPDISKAWQIPGDITEVPRLDNNSVHATNIGQGTSTRWLVSGDYLNFRSISFGYTIPSKILNNVQLKSARLSVSAENLLMLKARDGLNPQSQFNGLTYNEYMPARNITLGLKVSF